MVGEVVEDDDETVNPFCSRRSSLKVKDERCQICFQSV